MHQLAGTNFAALQHPQVKVGVLKDQREITTFHIFFELLPLRLVKRLEVEPETMVFTPELNEANMLATLERKGRHRRLSITSGKRTKITKMRSNRHCARQNHQSFLESIRVAR